MRTGSGGEWRDSGAPQGKVLAGFRSYRDLSPAFLWKIFGRTPYRACENANHPALGNARPGNRHIEWERDGSGGIAGGRCRKAAPDMVREPLDAAEATNGPRSLHALPVGDGLIGQVTASGRR